MADPLHEGGLRVNCYAAVGVEHAVADVKVVGLVEVVVRFSDLASVKPAHESATEEFRILLSGAVLVEEVRPTSPHF